MPTGKTRTKAAVRLPLFLKLPVADFTVVDPRTPIGHVALARYLEKV